MSTRWQAGALPGWVTTANTGPGTRARARWSLDQVRRAVFANPDLALRYLEAEAEAETRQRWNPTVLLTLRAEAHLRAGEADEALDAAAAAAGMPDAAPDALLAAVAVLADISCWTGDTSAADACHDYAQIAQALADTDRALCAAAMTAVAGYQQHSCERGREQLQRVEQTCRERPAEGALAMVTDARTVMELGCQPGGYNLDQTAWAPVPGGQLCPAGQPWSRYLTSRLRRRPATHTCGTSSAPTDPTRRPNHDP